MADPPTLAASIESLGLSRVACVGDLMLDRFVYGRVERTSPEAPVPRYRQRRNEEIAHLADKMVEERQMRRMA